MATNKQTSTAIFPGSFDPFHNGHALVLQTAAKMYDKVIIYVANNSAKFYDVDLKTRFAIVKKAVLSLDLKNVEVVMQDTRETTAEYTKRMKIQHIVRGLRDKAEVTPYESNLAEWYLETNHDLQFHYIVVPMSLSGTEIRNRLKLGKSIMDLVVVETETDIRDTYGRYGKR